MRIAWRPFILLSLLTVFDSGPSLADVNSGAHEAATIQKEARDLQLNYRQLVRRARNYDAPGVEGGRPKEEEVIREESRLLKWRDSLQSLFEAGNGVGATLLHPEAKLKALQLYFDLLTSAATVRIALGLKHGPGWSDPFEIKVPQAVLKQLPSLISISRTKMGDPFQFLVMDSRRGTLRISPYLIQGIEIAALSDRPTDETFLTLIQYLAIRQLAQNLEDLRSLKSDHQVPAPRIPLQLTKKFESLGWNSSLVNERNKAVLEPQVRLSALQLSDLDLDSEPFMSEDLASKLSEVLVPLSSKRSKVKAVIKNAFRKIEKETIKTSLESRITQYGMPFVEMSKSELESAFLEIWLNARKDTQQDEILRLMIAGQIQLDTPSREKILDLLESRRKQLEDSIPPTLMSSQVDRAFKVRDDETRNSKRILFIENLMTQSRDTLRAGQNRLVSMPVDWVTLARSLIPQISGLKLKAPLKNGFQEIIQNASSHSDAKEKFSLWIKALSSPISPSPSFIEEPGLHLKVEEDIAQLNQIATWMGFDRSFVGQEPTLLEIMPDPKQRELYFSTLTEMILDENSILGTQVQITAKSGRVIQARLYEVLTWLNPYRESREWQINQAAVFVDQALEQVEKNIQQNIERVGSAQRLEDLQTVIESSMILEWTMGVYPEFIGSQRHFLTKINHPTLIQQILRKPVSKFISWGFGALMLMEAVKWSSSRAAPPIQLVMTSLEPWIRSYVKTAMIFIGADTAQEVYERRRSNILAQEQETLFGSVATGGSFYGFSEMAGIQSERDLKNWLFVGRITLDTLMMWRPLALGAFATPLATSGITREEVQVVKRIGLRRRK